MAIVEGSGAATGGVDETIAAMQQMAADHRKMTLATMAVQDQMSQDDAVANINKQRDESLRANTRTA